MSSSSGRSTSACVPLLALEVHDGVVVVDELDGADGGGVGSADEVAGDDALAGAEVIEEDVAPVVPDGVEPNRAVAERELMLKWRPRVIAPYSWSGAVRSSNSARVPSRVRPCTPAIVAA